MKYFITPLFVFFTAFVYGQYDHNIELNDGTVTTHNVTEIDSISFPGGGVPALHMELFDGSSASVDLENIDQVTFSGEPTEEPEYPEGTVHCLPEGTPTAVVEVLNPLTGKIWMDRNLGAAQAATASDDEAAYGDLYQWGRFSDGHQCRNSSTTSSLSSSSTPDHGNFILSDLPPWNWLTEQNNTLWQGVNGTNNPCPELFRIPSEAEWNAEALSWSTQNTAGAFGSVLKLPAAGYRFNNDGSLSLVTGAVGLYWGSTAWDDFSYARVIESGESNILWEWRALGLSIRCIKD